MNINFNIELSLLSVMPVSSVSGLVSFATLMLVLVRRWVFWEEGLSQQWI